MGLFSSKNQPIHPDYRAARPVPPPAPALAPTATVVSPATFAPQTASIEDRNRFPLHPPATSYGPNGDVVTVQYIVHPPGWRPPAPVHAARY